LGMSKERNENTFGHRSNKNKSVCIILINKIKLVTAFVLKPVIKSSKAVYTLEIISSKAVYTLEMQYSIWPSTYFQFNSCHA